MSTSRIDSSASGLTPISSRACRATARIASVSTSTPDSLAISMDIAVASRSLDLASPPGTATTGGSARHGAGGLFVLLFVVALIGVDDLGHQPVTHHIGAAQLREVHVVHVAQDLPHDPQPADR